MSYDIYLHPEKSVCPTCLRGAVEPDLPNPTYNLTPIFDLALTNETLPNPKTSEAAVVLFREKTDRPRGLRLLSGRKAKDTIGDLQVALARLKDPENEEKFRALEPDNKWGTLEDAIFVMARLIQEAIMYPGHEWEIH